MMVGRNTFDRKDYIYVLNKQKNDHSTIQYFIHVLIIIWTGCYTKVITSLDSQMFEDSDKLNIHFYEVV